MQWYPDSFHVVTLPSSACGFQGYMVVCLKLTEVYKNIENWASGISRTRFGSGTHHFSLYIIQQPQSRGHLWLQDRSISVSWRKRTNGKKSSHLYQIRFKRGKLGVGHIMENWCIKSPVAILIIMTSMSMLPAEISLLSFRSHT